MNCRTNAGKRRAAGLPESVVIGSIGQPPAEVEPPGAVSTFSAANGELVRAGRFETSLGQSALQLARRIDANQDTGSALAALVGRFEATMTSALAGAPVGDVLDGLEDELAARRAVNA